MILYSVSRCKKWVLQTCSVHFLWWGGLQSSAAGHTVNMWANSVLSFILNIEYCTYIEFTYWILNYESEQCCAGWCLWAWSQLAGGRPNTAHILALLLLLVKIKKASYWVVIDLLGRDEDGDGLIWEEWRPGVARHQYSTAITILSPY